MTMDNKLRPPKFDFDSEEVRYNHRFAPFGNVGTPPPVPYSQFKVNNCILPAVHFLFIYRWRAVSNLIFENIVKDILAANFQTY